MGRRPVGGAVSTAASQLPMKAPAVPPIAPPVACSSRPARISVTPRPSRTPNTEGPLPRTSSRLRRKDSMIGRRSSVIAARGHDRDRRPEEARHEQRGEAEDQDHHPDQPGQQQRGGDRLHRVQHVPRLRRHAALARADHHRGSQPRIEEGHRAGEQGLQGKAGDRIRPLQQRGEECDREEDDRGQRDQRPCMRAVEAEDLPEDAAEFDAGGHSPVSRRRSSRRWRRSTGVT